MYCFIIIIIFYKAIDVSFDYERIGSDLIRFPPDQTFLCCLKFEFERGVFNLLFFFKTHLF